MTARIAALVMAAALLGACDAPERPADAPGADAADSAATATAADAGPKACDLVSHAELEQALALELAAGRMTNDYAGDSKCEWNLPGDPQRGVRLSLRRLDNLDIYRNVPGGINAPNIGEEAIWNAGVGQLAVRQGDRVVSLALLVPDPQREVAEEIVRLALDRL